MTSTRPVSGEDGVELLGSAAALRWSRPDLTGSIADHVLEIADADADDALWLRAAGWAVYARSATGDGRGVASTVLDGVVRRGAHVLDEPAADRLRVELALLACGADRLAAARTLLTPVAVADTAAELRADALCALSRCAMQDRPTAVEGLLRRVDATWAEVGGRRGHIGTAAASLVAAAAERRAGRPELAVERAAAGLASLESARGTRAQSPSRHLAAGLAAEWLAGLLDAGRTDEARDGCVPMEPRLRDTSRPSRQTALLRLTVARTVTGSGAQAVARAVAQAARDAVASDAPDLEAVCSSTLGALQEKSGQLGDSHESISRGEGARRRDEERAHRFRAALDALVAVGPGERSRPEPERSEAVPVSEDGGRNGARHRTDAPADPGVWTDWSSAVARDRSVPSASPDGRGPAARVAGPVEDGAAADRSASDRAPRHGSADTTDNGFGGRSASNGAAGTPAAGDDHGVSTPSGEGPETVSPWQGWTEESPIGRLVARSLQAGDPSVRKQPNGTRPQRRYPDAVTDPWSTGSWSTGHWAATDLPAGRGTNGSTRRDEAVDEPRPGRGGRRRRADPETVLPTPAAGDAAEQDGSGPSVWARGSDRGSAGGVRPASDTGGRDSSRRGAEEARPGAEETVSERDGAGPDVTESGHGAGAGRGNGLPADPTGWAMGVWGTAERVRPGSAAERRTSGGPAAAVPAAPGHAAPGHAAPGHAAPGRGVAERSVAERAQVERGAVPSVAAEGAGAEGAAAESGADGRAAIEQVSGRPVVADKAAAEQAAVRAAAERRAAERAETERAETEAAAAEREAAEREAAERAAVEQAAAERAAVEAAAAERTAAEQAAAEQAEAARAAAERAAAEQAEAAQAEAARAEAERVAAEQAEAERVAAERAAAEQAAERAAAERAATERGAAEEAAAQQAAAENSVAARAAAERIAAVEREADRAVEPGSGSWLQNALAELDRALGVSVPVGNRPAAPAPEAEGCVVVVDLAREGRRFAGRRAGMVVRALAERLTDRLPAGARLRHDDSDALSVVLPGWTRSPATEWMHRTLPGLFEEFVTDEDLPGTQLRAAVHDTDGPVGAQLLQRLDGPARSRPAPDPLTDPIRESSPTGGGRRHRRAADGDRPEASVDVPGQPPATGRPDPAADTDGLGLADLLAGALAAYRGI